MARRYSTRSRRGDGSATAEPAVGGLTTPRERPPEHGGYFEHSEFRARLDELREACRVAGCVILVTGPAGSGKSVVCDALLEDIEWSRCVASVSASESGTPYADVLVAILEAYGFEVEAGTTEQVMAELIAHHAGDPGMPGRQCVVVVDDAHALPTSDLHALLSLVGDTALTLVLAGPTSIVPAVQRVAQQGGLEVREVRLNGVSAGEANAYAEWRQAREDVRSGAAPARSVTAAEVKGQARRSRGLPGRVDQLIARLRAAAGPGNRQLGPFGFPLRHLVILAGLVAVLVVVWLVGLIADEITTSATTTQRIETLEMPPLPAQADDPTAADPGAARAPTGSTLALPPAAARSDDSSATEAVAPRPIIARPNQGAMPPGGAASTTQEQQPAPGRSAPEAAAPASAPTATPPVVRVPTAPAPSQSASTAAPPDPAGATRPAPIGTARDANWILAQPSGAFTLQLVSLSSADRARAYIAQQPDPGAFATYRLMRNGQIFHVVVYGTFPSKAEADQAAARLPRSVGNVQPWVRQFGQVQESIRSTPQ